MQATASQPIKELANLAKSYATLESLKLRLRMKPAPKPIDVSVKPAKRVKSVAFTEDSGNQSPKPNATKPDSTTNPDTR